MPPFVPNNRGYDCPTCGELCSFDDNGLTLSIRFGPSETTMSDDRILSFEVGFLERGTVPLERKVLLRQKHGLLLREKEFARFLYDNIENLDQGGSRFTIAMNVEYTGLDEAFRSMRKALMLMSDKGALSLEKVLPFLQYIAGLQASRTDPAPRSVAEESLVTGVFRARLDIPQITG